MKEVDYIVVGLGIAGICFCELLEQHGKNFVVFDPMEEGATRVAGGVVNPVVLKRFTPVWNVDPFLKEAFPFYRNLKEKLKSDFLSQVFINRIFKNTKEQNDWLVASESKRLSAFLSSEMIPNTNTAVVAPLGLGRVREAFRMDTSALIEAYGSYLRDKGHLITERFDHAVLHSEEKFRYKNFGADKMVFAEGAAAIRNPYFTIDNLIPKKGEYLIVKAPELKLEQVVKGSFFVIPLGNDLYKVGATFAHGDVSPSITENGRGQLEEALRTLIDCPFEVMDQITAFRPTVSNRRPLLGNLKDEPVYFFNGLGTRGLLMAPLLASQLYAFIEEKIPLPEEVDIRRFS